jgi:hypothetical protein
MTFPSLPAQGSTSWYSWASSVHGQVANPYLINVVGEGADGSYNDNTGPWPNSTAAFASAISKAQALQAASTSNPAVAIFVPPGTYNTGPLVLPNRVSLVGAGAGSTRLQRANANPTGPFISTGSGARACSVQGLTLMGGSGGDTSSHGIALDSAGAGPFNDARHHVSDVRIQYVQGNGIHQVAGSTGVCFITRVEVVDIGGHGFMVGTDSYYTDCDAGSCGLDGFYIRGANNRLTSCKAWFAGAVATVNASTPDGTAGHGFHFDANWSTNTVVNCEAQDNRRAGFYIKGGGQQVLNECHADSNNVAGLAHAGFELLGTTACRVSGFAWDRAANTNKQIAGYRVTGGGGNWIDITARTSTMAQGLRTTDSSLASQNIAAYNIYNGSGVGTIGVPS